MLFFHHSLLFLFCFLLSIQANRTDQNADAIIRFQKYLQINTSPTGMNFSGAVDFLRTQADELNLEFQHFNVNASNKPLVVLKWLGSQPNLKSIMLLSHIDVVPADDFRWTYPPFEAKDVGGKIYARGAQDMKSIGIQYLEAIRRLKAENFKPLRTIYLIYTPDEETVNYGIQELINSPDFKSMNIGFGLDEGMPSTDDTYLLFPQDRQNVGVVVSVVGVEAHSSQYLENTVGDRVADILKSMAHFSKEQHELVKSGEKMEGEVVTLNNVFLKSGQTHDCGRSFTMNTVPDKASLGVSIRIPPKMSNREITNHLNSLLSMDGVTWQKTEGYGPLVDDSKSQFSLVPCNLFWESFIQGLENAAVMKRKVGIYPAGTSGKYVRLEGIPVVGFSPIVNTPNRMHIADEFLGKDTFLKGIETYMRVIVALTNTTQSADLQQPNTESCPGDFDIYGRKKFIEVPKESRKTPFNIPKVVWVLIALAAIACLSTLVYFIARMRRRTRFLDLDG